MKMQVFSFDSHLLKTADIRIPPTLRVKIFQTFTTFRDQKEEVAVILANNNSNGMFFNIVSSDPRLSCSLILLVFLVPQRCLFM